MHIYTPVVYMNVYLNGIVELGNFLIKFEKQYIAIQQVPIYF